MQLKSLRCSIALTAAAAICCCLTPPSVAALRRTPKVYNALITTDENLLSSRAYPVIQPTIHETGIAHPPPFGPYHPFGYYSPLVRFGQPIAPGLAATPGSGQLPYPLPAGAPFPPQYMRQPPPQPPAPQSQPNDDATDPQPTTIDPTAPTVPPPTAPAGETPPTPNALPPTGPGAGTHPLLMAREKLPIALNQYGLPPALIPLPAYAPQAGQFGATGPSGAASGPQPTFHLPPYGYNPYSLLYNPLNGYRSPFLPPYDYFPGHPYAPAPGAGPLFNPAPHSAGPRPAPTQAVPPTPAMPPPTPAQAQQLPDLSNETEPEQEPELQSELDALPTLAPPAATETSQPIVVDGAPPPPPQQPQPFAGAGAQQTDFETIRNGSKSTDNGVADVPPPPIPSGAKTTQS